MSEVSLDYLMKHPRALEELAPWLHQEWGHHNNERSVVDRIRFMQPRLTEGGIPTSIVALVGGRAAGTASLIEDDFESRPHYTPWLATLYVVPDFRCRGIGELLIERIREEARCLGVATLYLTTAGAETYYERLGWSRVEQADNHGRPAWIMKIEP
ncbi:MAG: GNAT family N-acetyltransferase [Bdellovibrionales bacterium]|nr:GNAT family N-acetyltransferase [Bdellovibrionales bacterium]